MIYHWRNDLSLEKVDEDKEGEDDDEQEDDMEEDDEVLDIQGVPQHWTPENLSKYQALINMNWTPEYFLSA